MFQFCVYLDNFAFGHYVIEEPRLPVKHKQGEKT